MYVVFFSFLQRCKKSFDSYVEHFPVIDEEEHRLISIPIETDEIEAEEEERVLDMPANTNYAEESDRSATNDESQTAIARPRRRRDRLKGVRKFFSGLCSCFRRRPL